MIAPYRQPRLALRSVRGFHTVPDPPLCNTGRLEVPVLSLISLTVSTCIWLASLDRAEHNQENSVSLRDFIDTYLKKGRVNALYVLGRDRVEAHTSPAPSDGSRSSWLSKLLPAPNASPPSSSHEHLSPVCLRLSDPSYLQCLVAAYCQGKSPPPVYHVPTRERLSKWQKRLLLGSALAATFCSVAYRPPVPKEVRLTPTKHDTSIPSPPDKLTKFGQVQLRTDIPNVSFADVAGLDQAKLEIREFVEFLKNPEKFRNLGANMPRGALLVGPPGTGKTLLAKAVAGEANVPFYSTSGSDFIETYVGVGSSRIRDLFEKARRTAPSIVFIDEIDTIGRSRSSASHMGNSGTDERESTLNALLVELDGFNSATNIVTLAGTNRGDVLDPALTRPGRFDRQITLSKPNISERVAVFEIYLRPLKLDPELSKKMLGQRLAALTPGFSGAEIKNVCNEAAIFAARRDSHWVQLGDFETAVERLVGGLRQSGEVLNVGTQNYVAIHEAGHAVCGWFLAEADPVLKLSIIPRANGALGYTQTLPNDLTLSTKEEIEAEVAVLLGGRAAELLYCPTMTTGASDDLARAMRLCRAYVCKYGFDEEIGLRVYGAESGRPGSLVRDQIEARIDRLLREQWERCLALLRSKADEIRKISTMLLEREVISYLDLESVLGKPARRMSPKTREFVEALPVGVRN